MSAAITAKIRNQVSSSILTFLSYDVKERRGRCATNTECPRRTFTSHGDVVGRVVREEVLFGSEVRTDGLAACGACEFARLPLAGVGAVRVRHVLPIRRGSGRIGDDHGGVVEDEVLGHDVGVDGLAGGATGASCGHDISFHMNVRGAFCVVVIVRCHDINISR